MFWNATTGREEQEGCTCFVPFMAWVKPQCWAVSKAGPGILDAGFGWPPELERLT